MWQVDPNIVNSKSKLTYSIILTVVDKILTSYTISWTANQPSVSKLVNQQINLQLIS